MAKIFSSSIAYDDYLKIRRDLIEQKDGAKRIYSVLLLPGDAAIVLAQDKEGKYVLNYEYRHPTGLYLLGCPGGIIENGEDPKEAAKRELLEETGYEAEELFLIGASYPFPGVSAQKIYYFFGKNAVKKQTLKLDPVEIIETRLLTEEELKNAIRTQPNIDSILCTALWYKNLTQ